MKHALVHRCDQIRIEDTVDPDTKIVRHQWVPVRQNMPCLVDLQYVRPNRMYGGLVQTSGKTSDKVGLLALRSDEEPKPGDRFIVRRGPSVTLELDERPDEIWAGRQFSHYECQVRTVAEVLVQGMVPGGN